MLPRGVKEKIMSLPFRSILVPVDFDEGAVSALNLVKQLAAIGDAKIHLMHVVSVVLAPGEAAHILIVREEEVKAALEKMSRERLVGIRYQIHVRTGDIVRNIGGAARELKADLIIIPTHGRRGLPRLFLGSVAERVIRDVDHSARPPQFARESLLERLPGRVRGPHKERAD